MRGKTLLFHREIANTEQSIACFVKELSELTEFELRSAALAILHKKRANIWLEAALQIKRSSGNIRGKNDKVDAIRIAGYCSYKER